MNDLKAEVGKEAWDWTAPEKDPAIYDTVKANAYAGIENAYTMSDKMERQDALAAIRDAAVEALAGEESEMSADDVKGAFSKLEK